MKLGRIATITKVFVAEGLGFLTEDAVSDGEGQAADCDSTNWAGR